MDFLDKINEKTIIVCPDNIKNKLLNEINKRDSLINVKIYSLEELKRIICFDYDINAILYLMEKYSYSVDIAKYYINNLYYVEDKEYNNEKLDFLVSLKNELIDNNLLTYNKLFIKSYKNTKFLIFGYDYIDSFNKKLLSNFDYEIISNKYISRVNDVYRFNTLEEEIVFVINEIISLINKEIDLNNIYLLNVDSNYKDEIIRLFNMFKIPVDIDNSSSIISTVIGKKIYDYLNTSKSFEETVNYMESLNNDSNQLIINRIINIFNKYVGLDYSFNNILKCIKSDFEKTIINNNNVKNKVRIGDLYDSYYDENDYVFLLGFNQGSIPKVFKDEDYISDDLKEILGLDTTLTLNKERISSTTKNINNIKNITISYKKYYMKEEFYSSNLLGEKEFVEKTVDELNTENSLLYSEIVFAKMLDNLINYDEKNDNLGKYYNSLKIRYRDYDNKYKSINKNDLLRNFNNYLLLSYSSINNYFKCQFRYYINNILKLNKYDDSFDAFIGNLFHYVLSCIDKKDFDFDKEYNDYLKERTFSSKEEFYINKLKEELRFVCNFLKEFRNDTKLKQELHEKEINIDKTVKDINVIFKGYVDKIMYEELPNQTLISIIDYKTGNTEIKLDYAKEGIDLQLFIYIYLISKNGLFKNPYFVGFYLQNILNEIVRDPNKTYLEQKNNSYKLHGYSTTDRKSLEEFDPTYDSSKYIQSMSVTAKGEFNSKSKVLDENTMKKIVDFIDNKVNEARDNILEADFKIEPKYFNGDKESIGCKNCHFKDICFMKNEDIKYLDKNTSFDFLKEGDIDD